MVIRIESHFKNLMKNPLSWRIELIWWNVDSGKNMRKIVDKVSDQISTVNTFQIKT